MKAATDIVANGRAPSPRRLLTIGADMEALEDLIVDVDLALTESGGELTPEIAAARDAVLAWRNDLSEEFATKIDNCAALIRTLELRAKARRDELERLQTRIRVDEGNAKWLKAMVKDVLDQRGIDKIETARYRISVQANGGKQPVFVDPVAYIPAKYAYQPPVEWDKEHVRADLEAGKEILGAMLLPRGTHLAIK